MHAVDIAEPKPQTFATLELVWTNPEPVAEQAPALLLECRNRRHAQNILSILEHGFIQERRRGDKLAFFVFEGREPVRLTLIPGSMRTAA
ncbi:MAG: hypothetical protein ACI80V_002195 [Rhodothermales bacterium]|jgi:hypothetical protein